MPARLAQAADRRRQRRDDVGGTPPMPFAIVEVLNAIVDDAMTRADCSASTPPPIVVPGLPETVDPAISASPVA